MMVAAAAKLGKMRQLNLWEEQWNSRCGSGFDGQMEE